MILIDAHVHIYDCYDQEMLFDSAWNNFSIHAAQMGQKGDFSGVLLLADRKGQDFFSEIQSQCINDLPSSIGKWQVEFTPEKRAIQLSTVDGQRLHVLRGWQLVSLEGVEVLSLMHWERPEDGLPLAEQIAMCQGTGVVVIPWAFGKWFGKRGRVLAEAMESTASSHFFLGDNGGRPGVLPSSLLKGYWRNNLPLISGSDPLPIPGEEKRVGSFGVCIDFPDGDDNLCTFLERYFTGGKGDCQNFGSMSGVIPFLRSQYLLRKSKG